MSRLKQCQTPPPPPQAGWQSAWINKSIQQLLDFTSNFFPLQPPQSQGKATAEMQPSQTAPSHRPPAGLLRVTPALRGDFHLTVYVGSYILLSLFLLSPTSYTFNFLEANWKGSHCLQEGHLPWRFLSSFWQSSQQQQQQQLKAQITEPQLTARLFHLDCQWALSFEADSWSHTPPVWHTGTQQKGFSLWRPFPSSSPLICEPCSGNKDDWKVQNPQGFAPLHTWPWLSIMGWCPVRGWPW